MARKYDFDTHFRCPLHRRVKVIDLEPKQHSVSIWLVIHITDRPVMMDRFKAV